MDDRWQIQKQIPEGKWNGDNHVQREMKKHIRCTLNTSNDVALYGLLGNSRQASPVTAITKMMMPLMQVYHLETRSRNKKAPSLSYKMVIHSYSIIWSWEVKRTISTKLHRNSNVQIYILSMFRALALTGVLVFKNREQCEDLQSL